MVNNHNVPKLPIRYAVQRTILYYYVLETRAEYCTDDRNQCSRRFSTLSEKS